MARLRTLMARDERVVAGLMSGTSLDGVDAVVARLAGTGRGLRMETLAYVETPYPEALRTLLLRNSDAATSSVYDLSQLNVRLAHVYADAVRRAAEAAGLGPGDLDLVGSHGQTVHHVPDAADCGGQAVASTLQIGDPSVLANLLGVPVVGDFRVADMALGGQGAPLVPYFDYVAFADAAETRGLLNLGGIANLTVLPAGATPADVYAFDTGPANMVMDALAERLLGQPCDRDGAAARRGTVRPHLLETLLVDPYFAQAPPKSTGRERFGAPFVDRLLAEGAGLSPDDLLATAAELTARTVADAVHHAAPRHPLDVLVVSGGGQHNRAVMDRLAALLAPTPVRTTADYGVDGDAKEALCFAVLAHETLNGAPTNVPTATGARAATLLGKLCVPV